MSQPIEALSAELNRALREKGKKFGKDWRVRIRKLLNETFTALNAPKLDAARCNTLANQIELELNWLKDPDSISETTLLTSYETAMNALDGMQKAVFGSIPGEIEKEKRVVRNGEDDPPPVTPKSEAPAPELTERSVASQDVPAKKKKAVQNDSVPEESPLTPESAPKKKKKVVEEVPDEPDPTPKKKKKRSKLADIVYTHDSVTQAPIEPACESPSEEDPWAFAAQNVDPNDALNKAAEPEASAVSVPTDIPVAPPKKALPQAKTTEEPPEIGYFDFVSIQIRQFFTIPACVEPVRIAHTADFCADFADNVDERVERFIAVLSKPDTAIQFNAEITPGYEEELIKDMPERGLVLHPKRKKH